jgi:hypothetical protein
MTVVIIVVVVLVKVTFCPACNIIKTWIFHTEEENMSWSHSIFNVDIPKYKWLFNLWTFKEMLLTFIRAISVSNLGCDSGYPDWGCSWFSPVKCQDSTTDWIMTTFSFFQILSNLLFIKSSYYLTLYSEVLTVSLNELQINNWTCKKILWFQYWVCLGLTNYVGIYISGCW